MIKEVNEKDISECVRVIRDSFATVADELALLLKTPQNSLRLQQQRID